MPERETFSQFPENISETEVDSTLREQVEARFNQSSYSRLAEFITGLKPEDPKMLEKLATDREIIKAKYNLPPLELLLVSPSEYEHKLRQIAQTLNTKIREKSDCGKFFKENPFTGAVYMDDTNQIGTDIKKGELGSYLKSLQILEHELVHAIQNQNSPSMPIELMEYEAYLASGINLDYVKEHPESIDKMLFGFFIIQSVRWWYNEESKKRGRKVVPVWDNPEYFLQKDGIDLSEIKKSQSSTQTPISNIVH